MAPGGRARRTAIPLALAVTVASACSRRDPVASAEATNAGVEAGAAAPKEAPPRAEDAAVTAVATDAAPPSATDPFGVAQATSRASCGALAGHVAEPDRTTSFVDGDDLLALANRSPTGSLAPDWAPSDLVDLQTNEPRTAVDCERFQCLRREAAAALRELLAEMKRLGFPGKVESAFRSYRAQCGTFLKWAEKGGFCSATEQSALPGHSQHQLGTTVDLFTEEWAKDERGVFREGFGCTPAGAFLRERATELGFVMPYPIHPDDRHPKQRCVTRWDIPVNINPKTGYRYEHWHVRYVGKDAATRFERARHASGPGTPAEITVEQWLRAERGIGGADAELPVCDGCNCGACSTLAPPGESACDRRGGALHLDAHGLPLAPEAPPAITATRRASLKRWRGPVVEVKVEVGPLTATQPPIAGPGAAGYARGATFERLAPYPETAPRGYAPLEGAWVVALEPIPNDTGVAWPWRAALTPAATAQIYNRANVLLPARPGALTIKVPVAEGTERVKITLLEGGAARGEPRVLELR